jgi:hypothetical protein
MEQWLLRFHNNYPNAGSIPPEVAGASSFLLAFAGMIGGSLLSRRPAAVNLPTPEVPA